MKNLFVCCLLVLTQNAFAILMGPFSWEKQMKAPNVYVVHVKGIKFSEKRTGDDKADRKRWLAKLKAGGIDTFAYCEVKNTLKGKPRKELTIICKVHPANPMQQLEKNKYYMVFLDKNNRPFDKYYSFISLPDKVKIKKQPTPKQTLIV